MTTYHILRNATLKNCEKICKALEQPLGLKGEKYKRLIKNVENRTENVAYLSPEEWQRRVYNESIKILNELCIKQTKKKNKL